ncbi:MAG: phosphoribosylglycinamide formyltransferase [Chloroflexota bacterium]
MSACSIAVFISGSGSNLQALIDARQDGLFQASIDLVVSDRADAYGLQRALAHHIPSAYVPLPHSTDRSPEARAAVRADWEQQVLAVTNAFAPDIIVLSGFMRVLSATFLSGFPADIINQHPALLPDDSGDTFTTSTGLVIPTLRGAHVVRDALEQQLPITGCTVHRVTPIVDAGPVLARAEVPIAPEDTETTLHERIKIEERRLIVEVIRRLTRNSYV